MKGFRKFFVVTAIAVMIIGASVVIGQDQVQSRNQRQHGINDVNGDGICDVCGQPVGSGQANMQGKQAKKGKHWGPGDGTGNQGSGPMDGTGYGAASGNGRGLRDGTGPYHSAGGQARIGQGQGSGRRGGR
jgi:hypothetical protein